MLGLIGIRKNVDIKVREALSITPKRKERILDEAVKVFDEVVLISTCNRTEIYFTGDLDIHEIRKVFEILDWNYGLKEYTFYLKGIEVAKHLLEVVCGFHSRILGEDQILGQIKEAYELALDKKTISSKLQRLFQEAISCGKRFRTKSRLYEIPVSASSIAVNQALELGAEKLMVMGYGVIGSLVVKYALGSNLKEIVIVVRNKDKVTNIFDSRVKVLNFTEAKEVLNDMDAVISCTSAPHAVIVEKDIKEEGKNITLIDLALPRDIDENLAKHKRVTLFDIDTISKLDNNNKNLRREKMNKYKFIVDDYLNEYIEWLKIREISSDIKLIKEGSREVVDSRVKSFERKCRDKEDSTLAQILIKSTSDYYVNRAIKLLKEEKLKGREEECMKILEKIFLEN